MAVLSFPRGIFSKEVIKSSSLNCYHPIRFGKQCVLCSQGRHRRETNMHIKTLMNWPYGWLYVAFQELLKTLRTQTGNPGPRLSAVLDRTNFLFAVDKGLQGRIPVAEKSKGQGQSTATWTAGNRHHSSRSYGSVEGGTRFNSQLEFRRAPGDRTSIYSWEPLCVMKYNQGGARRELRYRRWAHITKHGCS